jgi:predicted RNA-binding protein YlqC (UPF0109 family)
MTPDPLPISTVLQRILDAILPSDATVRVEVIEGTTTLRVILWPNARAFAHVIGRHGQMIAALRIIMTALKPHRHRVQIQVHEPEAAGALLRSDGKSAILLE